MKNFDLSKQVHKLLEHPRSMRAVRAAFPPPLRQRATYAVWNLHRKGVVRNLQAGGPGSIGLFVVAEPAKQAITATGADLCRTWREASNGK